jgi:hypothetical protein
MKSKEAAKSLCHFPRFPLAEIRSVLNDVKTLPLQQNNHKQPPATTNLLMTLILAAAMSSYFELLIP